jgi:hypothetical protein
MKMIVKSKQSTLIDEVEYYRATRVHAISNNAQPISLTEGAKFVLHVIPSAAFSCDRTDITIFDVNRHDLVPMAAGGWDHKINFDGIAAIDSRTESTSYVQLFHNGVLEAVNAKYFHQWNDKMYIPITGWSHELVDRVANYINIERSLGISAPLFVVVSLLGVRGYMLAVENGPARYAGQEIDRPDLLIPAERMESLDANIGEFLLPILERLWNAAGVRQPVMQQTRRG